MQSLLNCLSEILLWIINLITVFGKLLFHANLVGLVSEYPVIFRFLRFSFSRCFELCEVGRLFFFCILCCSVKVAGFDFKINFGEVMNDHE